ncbi:MAG: thiazole biosynthesis protein [Lentisphaerae bacterium]|nr:thiazole biosynthesis protein [Lentisphaerota bacterium]
MSAENLIASAIIKRYSEKLASSLDLDVALVGGGPSALVAARDLAAAGFKTAIFEKNLAPGGGIWGGGMLFNEAVVQDNALPILSSFDITTKPVPGAEGYYTLDSVEMASGLIFGALRAGARIFNSVSVEDIIFKNGKVNGLVINWTMVKRQSMPVDPLTVVAEIVVDATGHPSEILKYASEKAQVKLDTASGGIVGEKPMWVDAGEAATVENTREYYPGLFACGMSATNAAGGYRMGPIFGGMLLSGQKVAAQIAEKLRAKRA